MIALYRLGTIHFRLGDHEKARRHHHQVLAIARSGVHERQGEHDKAVEHWQRALTTYRDLRAPKAAELQQKIAGARRRTG